LKKTKTSAPGVAGRSAILGAAFLMATSAIGPGFLTQTSAFTQELFTSFGFVILISILLDLGAQLNVWRIVTMSESRAQDLSNQLLPGLGFFLASLIAFGGLIFNIGNIAGCGLGINVLTGLSPELGAVVSCTIALGIFWYKEAGKAMDVIVKFLGILMIGLTAYVAITSGPPVGAALYRTVWPAKIDVMKIVTLVGGTVGGYISFAGAHRLLDAGIKGRERLREVTRSSVSGIVITSVMRYVLFLAALGVVAHGMPLSPANPAATVFLAAAGQIGYKFFGVVLFCAAITSVIGASFTTISFWKTLVPVVKTNEKIFISIFIVLSTMIFVSVGQPVRLLILAGAVNGIILPLALSIMLIASHRSTLMHQYRHSIVLQIIGWMVVAAMSWMGWIIIQQNLSRLF
jgi:Mn2+/Fe2+ NRAMP family transporter